MLVLALLGSGSRLQAGPSVLQQSAPFACTMCQVILAYTAAWHAGQGHWSCRVVAMSSLTVKVVRAGLW